MTRPRDRIDVDLDRPATIDQATAWSDLRAVVFEIAGVDIEKSDAFRVLSKPIKKTGNRRMSAYVAMPKDASDPADAMARGFISPFGEVGGWIGDQLQAGAQKGGRPVFAVPLSSAMKVLN